MAEKRGKKTRTRRMMLDQVVDGAGLCECGCGQRTKISAVNDRTRGLIRGRPIRFVHGHNRVRLSITDADYVVVDKGYKTPCWVWRHHLNTRGYGKVAFRGKVVLAHRRMYEERVGVIDDALQLDHLCRVPACIRPDHLEPVTHAENLRRGRSYWRERTHCKNGHPFSGDNLRFYTYKGQTQRICRACVKAAGKRRNERRRIERSNR